MEFYKLEVFIPVEHVEPIVEALNEAHLLPFARIYFVLLGTLFCLRVPAQCAKNQIWDCLS